MDSKSFILTSAGLKNIVQKGEEFTFIFGDQSIKMNNVFAEFLSPIVSRIHISDPTVDSIHFNYPLKSNFPSFEELINEDIMNIFNEISNGSMITIDITQRNKLQIISIFLNNSELFKKLQELFPTDLNDTFINNFLNYIQIIECLSKEMNYPYEFDLDCLIDYIAEHVESFKTNHLKKLPKQYLFKIISNEYLKIENYDSLFGTICNIFDEEKIDLIEFYEELNFDKLSDEKFKELMLSINPEEITISLWRKLCERIFNKKQNKYIDEQQFLYDGNKSNSFKGIIHRLTKTFGGNVHDKGIVFVNASYEDSNCLAKNVVKYKNKNDCSNRLLTDNKEGSWVQFDFKERQIHPTHYSIRSINWWAGSLHPQSWIIEGSNTGLNDWEMIDSQNKVDYLNGTGVSHTFEIKNLNDNNKYYRYIRMKQTGPNKCNNNYLSISAIEFFGKIKQYINN